MDASSVRVPMRKISKLLCLFMVSVSLSFLFFSTKSAKADLIDDVCAKTEFQNKHFCRKALRSDPRSQDADMITLAQITIDAEMSYVESTMTLIKSISDQTHDSNLKSNYNLCLEGYTDSIGDLSDCSDALEDEDYESLIVSASSVVVGPDECDEAFEDPPVSEPEELKQASLQIHEMWSALLVISNELLGQVE